jgi:hypothetical protein
MYQTPTGNEGRIKDRKYCTRVKNEWKMAKAKAKKKKKEI